MLRRVVKTDPAARGRYAALSPARNALSPVVDLYAGAAMYLADTLDWLNQNWQDNADNAHWYEDEFSAKQDEYFPQP